MSEGKFKKQIRAKVLFFGTVVVREGPLTGCIIDTDYFNFFTYDSLVELFSAMRSVRTNRKSLKADS